MKRKEIVQPLVLAGFLAVGFLVVWSLLALWAVEVADHVVGPDGPRVHLAFLMDGTPRVVAPFIKEYRDLDGNRVPSPADQDHRSWLAAVPLAATPPRQAKRGVPWAERIHSFADGGEPAVYWYFLSEGRADGTGYFVGYDSRSKTCVGYLGTAGFRQDPLPAEECFAFGGLTWGPNASIWSSQSSGTSTQHPINNLSGKAPRGSLSTWDVYLLDRDRKLYHADLHNRTVQVALDDPRVLSVAVVQGPVDMIRGTPHWLAVRTEEEVRVVDERGGLLHRYTIPEELRGHKLHFANTTTGEALLYANSPEDDLVRTVDYRIYWIASDGSTRKADVALPSSGELRKYQVLGGVVIPAPLVLTGLIATSRAEDLLEKGLSATYTAALHRALTEFWPALVIAQVIALLLAIACYRRQARYGASVAERVVWPLFVLVLGLPGWLGYRFGRAWPVLETCPACNTGVPRDRPVCVHCEVDFRSPGLKGTEVFA